MLSEIEKEEFLRSKTHCGSSYSVPEPGPLYVPGDEHALPGQPKLLNDTLDNFYVIDQLPEKKFSFLMTFRKLQS